MTRDHEIIRLLEQVPGRSRKQLVAFLRDLARTRATVQKQHDRRDRQLSVADRSFGMIQADAATVREVLSDELYDVE